MDMLHSKENGKERVQGNFNKMGNDFVPQWKSSNKYWHWTRADTRDRDEILNWMSESSTNCLIACRYYYLIFFVCFSKRQTNAEVSPNK